MRHALVSDGYDVPPSGPDLPPPEAETPDALTAAIASALELNATVADALPPCWTETEPGHEVTAASADGEWATITDTVTSTSKNAITSG